SHFKVVRSGVRDVEGALGLIDRARARGLDVTLDAYQYNAGSSMLQPLVPMWAHEGGPERLLERLGDSAVRQRIRAELEAQPPNWASYTVASVGSSKNRALEGRVVSEAIAESGKDA